MASGGVLGRFLGFWDSVKTVEGHLESVLVGFWGAQEACPRGPGGQLLAPRPVPPPNALGPGSLVICRLAWTCPLNGQVVMWTGPHRGIDCSVDGLLSTIK